MNKNKDILLDILEKNWEPEQIYNMFPNPSPWKNEIEQEKTGYCWLITELHALMYFMSKKYGTKDIYFSLTDLIKWKKQIVFLKKYIRQEDCLQQMRK